jgi:hypothetical protein
LIAKHCYQIDKNNLLRQRLLSDSSLRRICGFTKVPSEETFSRRLTEFARKCLSETTLAKLVRQYHEGMLVRVIARDSTTIAGREKARNKKREVKVKKRSRSRPRKDEVREPKEMKRVERQLRQSPGKSLSELDKGCGWGCKTNSQGKTQYTKGYKLHLDVSDQGIPKWRFLLDSTGFDSQHLSLNALKIELDGTATPSLAQKTLESSFMLLLARNLGRKQPNPLEVQLHSSPSRPNRGLLQEADLLSKHSLQAGTPRYSPRKVPFSSS